MAEAKKSLAKATKPEAKSKKVETKIKATKVVSTAKENKDGNIQKNSAVAVKADQQTEVVASSPAEDTAEQGLAVDKPIAKAGKRSEKSLKEAEEKQAKEERKSQTAEAKAEDEAKPKHQQKPARSKLERKGKKFRKVAELVDASKTFSISEAIDLAIKTSPVKFDATVELHIRLGVDPRQADQNIRDMVVLPAGTGKTLRIAVFADPDGVTAAKKAGADIAAGDEFLQQLDKGVIDFDILIATPQMMAKLGKHARVLGPKGLMPNPKSGTVTTDVAKAVTEAKAGRVEYRVDSTGIVHVGAGKVSFGNTKLLQNIQAILNSIKGNKPASVKGNYVKSIYIATSMGPSLKVNTSEI